MDANPTWASADPELRRLVEAYIAVAESAAAEYTQEWAGDPCAETRGQMVAADNILARLRALLPPVSAPGPTLPEVPDGVTFSGGWAHVDRVLTVQEGRAVMAHLCARAERGPGAATPGEGAGD